MIAALRLLPLLVRRAPRQAAGAATLCGIGVAIATLVAGTGLAAYGGLAARESRMLWRDPVAVTPEEAATALQRRSVEVHRGQVIDRVDLAVGPDASERDRPPVPPGLDAVPAPGTAAVSPALARLIDAAPTSDLGSRFGRVVDTIGPAGLARPDELVAVVGAEPAELRAVARGQDPRAAPSVGPPGTPTPVTPIRRFGADAGDATLQLYREMALVAVVLVTVPALMLVGSAARLTAARRERRLAALRLAGATPGAVRGLAAAETAMGAVAGAVVGVAAALVVAPSLSGIEVAGGAWYPSDLRLSAAAALGLTAASVAVGVVATVVSLRRVTSQPLGVARADEAQRARWPRILALVASFAALAVAAAVAGARGPGPVLVSSLAVVILSLGLVGPWIVALVGRLMTWRARRPATLLAGRRIEDDPRSAYRVVSSVVLAGLIAGFLAGILPTTEKGGGAVLVADVRRGSLVILLAGLVLAAGSSAVAAAASVIDQRRTIARLVLTGMPISLLQSARRWQSTVPLVCATAGAVAVGLGSAVLMMLGFGVDARQLVGPELLQLVAIVAGAALIGLLSAAATRPLLVAVARSPADITSI